MPIYLSPEALRRRYVEKRVYELIAENLDYRDASEIEKHLMCLSEADSENLLEVLTRMSVDPAQPLAAMTRNERTTLIVDHCAYMRELQGGLTFDEYSKDAFNAATNTPKKSFWRRLFRR